MRSAAGKDEMGSREGRSPGGGDSIRLRRRPPEPIATTDVNLGSARLVGQRMRLETAIANGRGTVRIADTTWQVTGPDLPAGSAVRVVGSDGIVLSVEP